ncbi:MAG TPA: ABC transporter permease [Feifaniaceae bacterium]|nr:ABC transporter permease [Feifaniaceae bacterium]
MKGYYKYFGKKVIWFIVTLICALVLNFFLPRLMPGDPVAVITAKAARNATNVSAIDEVYRDYARKFGTDQPMHIQFVNYIKNVFKGDLGISFSQYPRPVADILGSAIWWTIGLQFPAIIVGWLIGNLLGALAAYIRKGFDKVIMPACLFASTVPAFGMATFLLVVFGIGLKIAPTSGGYAFDLLPVFNIGFVRSVIRHYQLPFWSIVIGAIGGQAVGMRSMSIYELNADYVKYSRYLGIKDTKIVRYVFRNAMLPQITGLALSIGTMIGGALVAEIVFSYPGLGSTLLTGVTGSDYPLISASTLIITIMVLTANFIIEIIYGLIDPRVKAAQME